LRALRSSKVEEVYQRWSWRLQLSLSIKEDELGAFLICN
jgi:hypothetical protein